MGHYVDALQIKKQNKLNLKFFITDVKSFPLMYRKLHIADSCVMANTQKSVRVHNTKLIYICPKQKIAQKLWFHYY